MSVWHKVMALEALTRRSPQEAEAGRAALLLFEIEGVVYVTAAVCPHHATWLSQGGGERDRVSCPRHQGQFHIPTGHKLRGPQCPDLRTCEVEIRAGGIWVPVD